MKKWKKIVALVLCVTILGTGTMSKKIEAEAFAITSTTALVLLGMMALGGIAVGASVLTDTDGNLAFDEDYWGTVDEQYESTFTLVQDGLNNNDDDGDDNNDDYSTWLSGFGWDAVMTVGLGISSAVIYAMRDNLDYDTNYSTSLNDLADYGITLGYPPVYDSDDIILFDFVESTAGNWVIITNPINDLNTAYLINTTYDYTGLIRFSASETSAKFASYDLYDLTYDTSSVMAYTCNNGEIVSTVSTITISSSNTYGTYVPKWMGYFYSAFSKYITIFGQYIIPEMPEFYPYEVYTPSIDTEVTTSYPVEVPDGEYTAPTVENAQTYADAWTNAETDEEKQQALQDLIDSMQVPEGSTGGDGEGSGDGADMSETNSILGNIYDFITDIPSLIINGLATLLQTIIDLVTSILEAILNLPSLIASAFTSMFDNVINWLSNIYSGVTGIASSILSGLFDIIVDALEFVFLPSADTVEALQTMLNSKIPAIGLFTYFADAATDALESNSTELTFTADFSLANNTFVDYPDVQVNVLDVSWYAPYKDDVDDLIVSIAWLVFLWNFYTVLPSIISGTAYVTLASARTNETLVNRREAAEKKAAKEKKKGGTP